MSATLPNISDLSIWLDASLYVTTYRPVDLSVLISFDNMLYTVNGPRENESNSLQKLPLSTENHSTESHESIFNESAAFTFYRHICKSFPVVQSSASLTTAAANNDALYGKFKLQSL